MLGLLGTSCNQLPLSQSPPIESSMICPFEGTELVVQAVSDEPVTAELLAEVAAVISRRLEGLSIQGAAVFPEAENQVMVQLPLEADASQVESTLGNRGQLSFRAQKPGGNPGLLQTLVAEQESIPETDEAALQANRDAIAAFFEPPQLTGSQLSDAQAEVSASGGWEILIDFNDQGSQAFADLTQQLAGTGRALGVFLDDVLISAPTIDVRYAETGITGGAAVISGNFTAEAASDLALQLRSGAFPAPTEILSIQSVTRDENCQ
ncbi:MAG: hypothetical protein AAFW84_33465 [Cyanobacteria bacterium J06635_15]